MPIQFAHPHCGKQTIVADQYAGQSGGPNAMLSETGKNNMAHVADGTRHPAANF